mgnify:CR=1 FL=1
MCNNTSNNRGTSSKPSKCCATARCPLEETGKKGIVLAGRPYHVDPEVNHGIDKLITDCGAVLITEPSTGKILAMVSKPDYDPENLTHSNIDCTHLRTDEDYVKQLLGLFKQRG